jgi:hypothetical protein
MNDIVAEQIVGNSSSALRALELIISGGIGASLIGLLGKLWIDRKLAKERAASEKQLESLKAELAQKHTIHKLQFEKEFTIYQELWEALVRLKDASIYFRPGLEISKSEETPQQAEERKRKAFWDTYGKVVRLVELNKPFYAEEVYKNTSNLLSTAWSTPGYYAIFGVKGEPIKEVYDRMKGAISQMSESIDKIEESIRERIGLIGSAEFVE